MALLRISDRPPRSDTAHVLNASAGHDGNLYEVELDGMADIADLVCEERLESLTSTDGVIDFWLTPSLQPSHRRVNGTATELLLAGKT